VTIPAPGVYPTPVYETLAAFVLFAFLWSIRKRRFATGHLFSIYLLLCGFERLLIEKIRVNPAFPLFGAGVTQAEAISIVLIVIGLADFVRTSHSRRAAKIGFSLLVAGALSACAGL